MSFEQFQNQARLYVIGALDPRETSEFEQTRRQFGKMAEDCIAECYSLSEAFALSLKPAKASTQIKDRLMQMVQQRRQA
jgi:hypothetical protein